ncbi:hypothetical protein [Mycolicibacterium rhodesiae]|nr:hypothetical protein [Mycolicibacterium rhodesiae]
MAHKAITLAEKPELKNQSIPDAEIWPEFNLHGATYLLSWSRLPDELPEYQFAMCDAETGEVIADAHTVPCWWDGTPEGLPGGFDAAIADALNRRETGQPVNTLCAIAAEIPKGGRGTGLAAEILKTMGAIASRHGLEHMIAPVRPTWKDRYPITPIERYMTWRRDDGSLFDPWLRLHERMGARMGPAAPASYRIDGTVREWESWLGMALPESGEFVFPGGLSPLAVDRASDRATYVEPNVWMIHSLSSVQNYEIPQ